MTIQAPKRYAKNLILSVQSGRDAVAIQEQWKNQSEAMQQELYLEACREIGIEPEHPPTPGDAGNDDRKRF